MAMMRIFATMKCALMPIILLLSTQSSVLGIGQVQPTLRTMAPKITTFLMFQGDKRAEDAMKKYISLFPDSEVLEMEKYGPEQEGREGTVKMAKFRLGERELMCIDSPIEHKFSMTPAVSLFVDCTSEEELERLFAGLSEGGEVMMPLGSYGFSKKFAWTADSFGVSWQLNLA